MIHENNKFLNFTSPLVSILPSPFLAKTQEPITSPDVFFIPAFLPKSSHLSSTYIELVHTTSTFSILITPLRWLLSLSVSVSLSVLPTRKYITASRRKLKNLYNMA
jgi:hypothetical protein